MTLRLPTLAAALLLVSTAAFADPDEYVAPQLDLEAIYAESKSASMPGPEEEIPLRLLATPSVRPDLGAHTQQPAVPRSRPHQGLFASHETDGMIESIGLTSTTAILLAMIPIVMVVVALWSLAVAARAAEESQTERPA